MRLKEILTEEIVNKPRNLDNFIKVRVAKLDAMITDLERARLMFEKFENDGEEMARSFLRYGSDHADAADDYYLVQRLSSSGSIGLSETLEQIKRALGDTQRYGRSFLKFVLGAFDYRKKPWEDKEIMAAISVLDKAEDGAKAYGYREDEDHSDDESYVAAMNFTEALRITARVVIAARDLWKELSTKLGELEKRLSQGDRYRPDHDEVETLYHASAYATEIARDGFHDVRPDDRAGLGNLGSKQATISFTHDLKIAQDIMRALKEVWMIVHGQLTAQQIVSWIAKEGIDKEHPDLASIVGVGEEIPGAHPMFGNRYRTKQIHELKSLEETLKLYEKYLWFTKIRTNPVLTSINDLVPVMKTRSERDIGIVACQVNLTKQDEYLMGEAEFRLPASRVISVKRIA